MKKHTKIALGVGTGALAIAVIAGVAGSGGADQPARPPGVSQPAPADKPGKPPIKDGDWTMESVNLKAEFGGDFGGRARVTYTGDDPSAVNTFTVTVFKGGKDVATLIGSASNVSPNQTSTVTLISSDNYVSGPFTFDFQGDL